MTMSPERRAEIRAAVETIHPGPWFAVPINDDDPEIPTKDLPCIPHPHWDLCYGDRQYPSNVACILTDYDETGVKGKGDIDFIVGARYWIPELLDDIDELQGQVDQHALIVARLQAQLKEWEQYTGFLYAHGFFRDAPGSTVGDTPTTIITISTPEEDPPHV